MIIQEENKIRTINSVIVTMPCMLIARALYFFVVGKYVTLAVTTKWLIGFLLAVVLDNARKRRMGRKNPIVSAMYIIMGMLMFACIVSNTLGVFIDCSVYVATCICCDGMCCD